MFTSLLVGALGAGMQGLNSIKDNVLNNYYARKNASKEFRRTVDLNMENEYNKPVNQMARLKEAELNPNLVYGSGATTLAASTHGAPRSNESWQGVKAGFVDTINAYQDMRQKDAMTENVKAQTETLNRRVAMEERRLEAELINANNEAHLKGIQYGIMNNQLRVAREQADQSRLRSIIMRKSLPYELEDMAKSYNSKGFWRGWNNFWDNGIGTPIHSVSPFVGKFGGK